VTQFERQAGDYLRFDGRVAVVSGAGRGLGRAYAELLAARGAKVVVNDPGVALDGSGGSCCPAEEVVDAIQSSGGIAIANFEAVGNVAASESLIRQALEAFGRIDILVNNAGIFYPNRTFTETTPESFESLMQVHLMGTIHNTRAAWPHLVAQEYGKIVNVTSSVGYVGTRNRIEYGTAKAAIHGFTRTLSKESRDSGIFVNAVAPGALTRPVTASTQNFPEEFSKAFSPDLVAPAVVWLAHQDTDVNGEVFTVMAGTTAQVVIAATTGFRHTHPTPELLRENAESIFFGAEQQAAIPLSFYQDGEEEGMALVAKYGQ
jgi:NAD(P)-dependent dehydrogenase (short-subunit alcohol dehydrogenase family)